MTITSRIRLMRAEYFKKLLWAVSLSLLLVVAGHMWVLQRTTNNPSSYALTVRHDALKYIGMVEGNWESVNPPFRYRILVPLLARLIPLAPDQALRLLNYISLFMFYLICQHLAWFHGLKFSSGVGGIIAVFASFIHLYSYHDPYLTDSFQLMVIAAMLLCFFRHSFVMFLGLAVVGILARETTIFLTPAWFLRDRVKGGLVMIVALAAFVLPRVVLGPGAQSATLAEQASSAIDFVGVIRTGGWINFLRSIGATWGHVWFLGIAGLLFTRWSDVRSIVLPAILLGVGSVLTSLLATDMPRMFGLLSPVLCLFIGFHFEWLSRERKGPLRLVLLIVIVLCMAVAFPSVLFPFESWVFRSYLNFKIQFVLGAIYLTVVLVTERHQLLAGIRKGILILNRTDT